MIRQINNWATSCCLIQIHYPVQSSGVIVQQAVGQFTRIRSVAEDAREQALFTSRQDKLPSIEQIERELAQELNLGEGKK